MTKDEIVQQWRKNMAKPSNHDPDFEAFLEQEAQEIDEILASLQAGEDAK